MAKNQKTLVKVIKIPIVKPCDDMTWDELGKILRDVRYRAFRLANLVVSEAYLNFHLWRAGKAKEFKSATIGQLNRRLRDMLLEEGVEETYQNRFSKTGALCDYVVSALSQYKLSAVTNKNKWSQVIRGQVSLPVFRSDIAIPIRCDKHSCRRLEKMDDGEVQLDLMVTLKPYPRVILATQKMNEGPKTILKRLLDNPELSPDKYRQRCFEIKQDSQNKKWWLFATYDFPQEDTTPNENIIVGVDLGFSVPMYVAVNSGLARLGRRQFQALGRQIQNLKTQIDARRRSIQRGGRQNLSASTARSGHGRKRKLLPLKTVEKRVNNAYTSLNHQLSAAVIEFAKNHHAGVIQIEDLTGLQEHLKGTFLGIRWRYHQLQQFLEYKAKEAGITLRKINPKFTSRRCSHCGYITMEFDRSYRDAHAAKGKVAEFLCPQCRKQEDPDYNAARNIATLDIETLIRVQCKDQDIEY